MEKISEKKVEQNNEESSKNKDDIIKRLQREVNKDVKIDIKPPKQVNTTDSIIKNANNKFLLEVLSPEIIKNEEKKRKHKDALMRSLEIFLIFQFLIVAIMVMYGGYWIIKLQIVGKPFADSTIKIMLTFIGTYITSVIIELIAILKYIVKNVFDTSITGMVNNFKEEKK